MTTLNPGKLTDPAVHEAGVLWWPRGTSTVKGSLPLSTRHSGQRGRRCCHRALLVNLPKASGWPATVESRVLNSTVLHPTLPGSADVLLAASQIAALSARPLHQESGSPASSPSRRLALRPRFLSGCPSFPPAIQFFPTTLSCAPLEFPGSSRVGGSGFFFLFMVQPACWPGVLPGLVKLAALTGGLDWMSRGMRLLPDHSSANLLPPPAPLPHLS